MRGASNAWFTRPDVLDARTRLDAQFNMLGCSMGSSRIAGLVTTMVRHLRGQVEDLEEVVATIGAKGPEPETVATLAKASCIVFAEPTQSLAIEIDELGVTPAVTPGAYGRLWCRHTVDSAWTIWTASEAAWRGPSGIIAPTARRF